MADLLAFFSNFKSLSSPSLSARSSLLCSRSSRSSASTFFLATSHDAFAFRIRLSCSCSLFKLSSSATTLPAWPSSSCFSSSASASTFFFAAGRVYLEGWRRGGGGTLLFFSSSSTSPSPPSLSTTFSNMLLCFLSSPSRRKDRREGKWRRKAFAASLPFSLTSGLASDRRGRRLALSCPSLLLFNSSAFVQPFSTAVSIVKALSVSAEVAGEKKRAEEREERKATLECKNE
mmetsp:Transcript_11329/g.29945  ORF Transcript_11329/g.29945 Transcript_11329/m.29945 type:complete len:232 (-) Transcript_11329:1218-1913(-)